MGGKLNIYNLGTSGVVVDKSPIHEQDGELLRAQNAQVDSVGALGGIRKRDGFLRLNPLSLAGAVMGMLPLPLPDEGAKIAKFYLPLESGANWKSSNDGVTWIDTSFPSRAVTSANGGLEGATFSATEWATIWRGFRNKLYYPGNDYVRGVSNPTIHLWDGTTDAVIATITPSPYNGGIAPAMSVTSIMPYAATELLVAVADGNTGHGASRVFILDTASHQLTQLGPNTNLIDGFILGGIALWQGRIWIGGYHGDGGAIVNLWWTRSGDPTWTPEITSNGSAHGYVTSMVVFKGELYVSYAADLNAHGDIYKSTPGGVWSEVYASDGMAANNYVGPMIVSQDGSTLFAFQNSISGGAAPQIRIIQSTSGSSFSLAYDVSTALSNGYARSGMPYIDAKDGTLYWPLASGSGGGQGGLLKRTVTGTWSIVLSNITTMRGPLGIIKQ